MATAIAAAEDVEPTTLTPLSEAVDIVAFEQLFFGRAIEGPSRGCTGQIQFRYRGFRVTVTSNGQIVVAAPVRADASE